jgi:predicted 3-demethylubiquinone-9 3-methyltransferase (glyoxalase superfamily)
MKKIVPMLWFDTQAEEAANFYCSVFRNSKVTKVTHYGEGAPAPKGSVMTVSFELDGQPFTALNAGPQFTFNESISWVVSCDSQEEVDAYWSKLTANGGQESMCGWLKDKYGMSWQITPTRLIELVTDKDRDKANRVFQAMMQMKKIDIAALERAAGEVTATRR